MFTLSGIAAYLGNGQAQTTDRAFTPAIPKMWDDQAMAALELPPADPAVSRVHVSADYYYRIPVRPIYKSYPVYAPGQEPEGYEEWLRQQEPEPAFDAAKLRTENDWIRAGETVFDAPTFYNTLVTTADVRDPQWYAKTGVRAAKDGTLPWFRYVIREKGKVEMGTLACGMCHTRVLDDGTVLKGAQGNFPFESAGVLFAGQRFTPERIRNFERSFFGAPWVKPDPLAGLEQMSLDQIIAWHAAMPAGVIARQGSSPLSPPQVPDLIGVKDRKYLDHTGLQFHRSIADMMRYAALNQGADLLASYNGFIPGARDFRTLPDPSKQGRYSDEQLYALALYLYSLRPPASPHRFDAAAARGQQVFKREGCAVCHTPPLYTSNKLIPADGFNVPPEHLKKYDILMRQVGTDATLTLTTRRGTGYYKVPSLKGLWYRSPLEHNGSVATLEDWFDPKRLCDDYAPTGFRGAGVKTRAVKGHPFGLNLTMADRQALIAFLKTL
ncbi:MAG: di-heme oxidoredictase family protein [Blastocatellia bacterium]